MSTRLAVNRRQGSAKAITAAALALVALLAFGASAALAAEAPSLLWKRGEHCAGVCDWGVTDGGNDIETEIPNGIATDPDSGHLYVGDQVNRRIIEFTAWGQFVKAWGWGVRDGSSELQVCNPATDCRAGIGGPGVGQLGGPPSGPLGVAVDSEGDVYVVDDANHRVQKFDPEGHFLLMFGGEVDKGPNHPGNVCTVQFVTEGDNCAAAATTGTANGQFGNWPVGSFIAIGPADQVYVGDENRIEQFTTAGAFVKSIALPQAGAVAALAVDPKTGSLYFAYPPPLGGKSKQPSIYKLDPATGNVLGTLEVATPTALATDPAGDLYVFDRGLTEPPIHYLSRVFEFDPAGKQSALFAEDQFGYSLTALSTGLATGSACFSQGAGVYVSSSDFDHSFILGYGVPDKADLCPPPPNPPTIAAQYAISVGSKEATLGAQINPHFWPDTTYSAQYATAQCIESAGWDAPCVEELPAPPAKLSSGVIDVPAATNGIFLSGLEPDTAYRYRFVTSSGGGGPTQGAERSFDTFPQPEAPSTDCPNQSFRAGPGAFLPDCRAYEMVSPLDKEGGDIVTVVEPGNQGVPARLDRSAPGGDVFTYSSYRSFAGAESAPYAAQYMAHRGEQGWQSEPISPPKEGPFFYAGGVASAAILQSPFKAFTADLSQGWVGTYSEPVLAPGGLPGFPNLYRRNAGGAYEACTTATPQVEHVEEAEPHLQGISADGSIGVFRANDALTPDANPPAVPGQRTNAQVYECREGEVRLVSILPDGTASTQGASVGTINGIANGEFQLTALQNAVSAGGERIFWTVGNSLNGEGAGKLYVRINGEETVAVSKGVAQFWAAARDGSKAIFSEGQALLAFEVDSEATTPIAGEVLGVAGVSEDASRVYFASREDLAGGAVAGQPNLYLYEAGGGGGGPSYAFVGSLAGDSESPITGNPAEHAAYLTPDGAQLVFATASPELAEATAGYDNTDVIGGKPDREVYRYDADIGDLACISCNPSGARPTGRKQALGERRYAADIPAHENSLYAPRVASEDGSRAFFESFEALAPADTNGKADVYEWEQAGSGDCEETDATYVGASGGCLSLISSGKSSGDSELVDLSADGSNVFIRTDSSLLPQDPGSFDIYDARVNGGFSPPPSSRPECEGGSCQSPAAAPNDPTPASASFRGPGDPIAKKPTRARCARSKAKKARASRCHKKQRHKRRRANHERRTGR